MRLLLIGDIVGKPGRRIVVQSLPMLREREQLDLIIANAENSAGSAGIDAETGVRVTDNTILFSGTVGIEANLGCVITGNSIINIIQLY